MTREAAYPLLIWEGIKGWSLGSGGAQGAIRPLSRTLRAARRTRCARNPVLPGKITDRICCFNFMKTRR
jgi:hypothetical protein